MKGKTLWDEEIRHLLSALGLSEKEALVYQCLLSGGSLPIGKIITQTGLKRGITYAIVYKLAKLGLVRQFEKEGKTYVEPEPPEKLAEIAASKDKELELTKTKLDHLLPKLSSQYKLSVGKPTIQYFEGKEGLIKVFQDIYAPKKEPVYGAVNLDQIESVFEGISESKLIPSRLENGLPVKCVFNNTPKTIEMAKRDKEENRESLLIDLKKYPLPAEVEAYEDKVALMSFKKGEFLGLIIQNEDFAITLRSLLRFLFDHRKALTKSD